MRFEPKEGTPVVGDQHRMFLPGRVPQPAASSLGLPSAASLRAAMAAGGTCDARLMKLRCPSGGEAAEQNDGASPTHDHFDNRGSAGYDAASGGNRSRRETCSSPADNRACRRLLGGIARRLAGRGRATRRAADAFAGFFESDATTSWLSTWLTAASRRATRSARSRSCSVATTPRRIAVRPRISTGVELRQWIAGKSVKRFATAELNRGAATAGGSKLMVRVVRIGTLPRPLPCM